MRSNLFLSQVLHASSIFAKLNVFGPMLWQWSHGLPKETCTFLILSKVFKHDSVCVVSVLKKNKVVAGSIPTPALFYEIDICVGFGTFTYSSWLPK